MRLGLVVIVLAACSSGSAPAGPAWPRPTPGAEADDGGESLAPRAQARAIAAIADDDKPAERTADAKAAATPAAADAADKPAANPPTMIFEEPIMTEEIVIEIEGD